MSTFLDSGKIKETSVEIMEAIRSVADSEYEAERIWAAPSEAELIAIWEIVTKNGLNQSTEYVWGSAGNSWGYLIETGEHEDD